MSSRPYAGSSSRDARVGWGAIIVCILYSHEGWGGVGQGSGVLQLSHHSFAAFNGIDAA